MLGGMSPRDEADEPTTLPKIATVHERTVRRAAEHVERAGEAPPRARAAEARPRTSRAEHIVVDPRVMKTALRLADGDASRLQINRDGSVRVR